MYGFRSQKAMPNVEELKDFKDACVDLIGGITQWNKIQSCYTSGIYETIKTLWTGVNPQ